MKKQRIGTMVAALLAGAIVGRSQEAATPVAPGQDAPAFELKDLDGNAHSLASFKGSYVVLEWTNYDCPFVKKHYETGNIPAIQKKLGAEGVVWLSVCSSAPGKQGNLPAEEWKKRMAAVNAAPKAVLLDPDGAVGKQYNAKNTPYVLVINPEGKVIFVGGIDNQPGLDRSIMGTAVNYVTQALAEAKAGTPVSVPTAAPYGCSVKY